MRHIKHCYILKQKGGSLMRMVFILSLLLCLAVSGCAIKSGVVKIGEDTYKVSHQAATGFEGGGGCRDSALLEASEFCASQGRVMKVIRIGGNRPPYILGNFPKTEVQFMCLDKNDPRLTEGKKEITTHPDDILENKIKNLKQLLSDGVITEDDFEKQKAKLLNDYTNN
jgi:hypothetical protein